MQNSQHMSLMKTSRFKQQQQQQQQNQKQLTQKQKQQLIHERNLEKINQYEGTIKQRYGGSSAKNNKKTKDQCIPKDDIPTEICEKMLMKGNYLHQVASENIRKFKRAVQATGITVSNELKSKNFSDTAQMIKDLVIYPHRPKCYRKNAEKEKIVKNFDQLNNCSKLVKAACGKNTTEIPSFLKMCNQIFENTVAKIQICNQEKSETQCKCLTNLTAFLVHPNFRKCSLEMNVYEKETLEKQKVCLSHFLKCKEEVVKTPKLLATCIGGKPDGRKPHQVSIGDIRKGQNTRRDGSVVELEMDVFENTHYFTQTTIYNKRENYVRIDVPAHGHFPHDVVASTTFYVQSGNNNQVFDTKIVRIEDKSYVSEIHMKKADIIDFILRFNDPDLQKFLTRILMKLK